MGDAPIGAAREPLPHGLRSRAREQAVFFHSLDPERLTGHA